MTKRPLRPLGVVILALLREGDMHPYEMMRLLRLRREDRLVSVQSGTFYNQIAGLERDGFISEVGIDREGNLPERTTYTLTPTGDQQISGWVRDNLARIDRPDDFRVALAEAHNIDRAEAARLLRGRGTALAAERDDLASALDAALARPVDRQYLIEVQRTIALLEADISFTSHLCAELEGGSMAWGRPSETHRSMRGAKTSGKDDA